MKFDFKKALPHIIAVVVFLTVSMAYFAPAMKGFMLKSHDVKMHKGMSREIVNHRDTYGEEPLWTNSMFGGMPATQISVIYNSNFINKLSTGFLNLLPHPINYLFLYMIGFYILLLCMKVDPWLALMGAIAYGFSSYFFIIMGAGHNSKAVAVGYMAPALGGFLMAYRRKLFLGVAIMTLFLAFQISANHPQVTYYFFILLGFIFLYEAIKAFKAKEFPPFIKKTLIIGVGVVLAISTNIPNLFGTYEYSPYTQRGGSELADNSKLEQFAGKVPEHVIAQFKAIGCDAPKCVLEQTTEELMAKTGLDKKTIEEATKVLGKKGMKKDYALQWSYGIGETWNFMIPNVKGGTSSVPLLANEDFVQSSDYKDLKEVLQLNYQFYSGGVSKDLITNYFGNQASTAGPVYIGAIVCFLFILAMVFWRSKFKWPLFAMVVLSIGLAWGKNFMFLTDLFWDYAPVYKSFRAVTIILVMVEFILPLVAILWLRDVIKNRKDYTGNIKLFGKVDVESKKLFFGVSGLVAFILLIFSFAPNVFIDLESEGDKAFFDQGNFSNQMQTLLMTTPNAIPAEYAENPGAYAGLVVQQYLPLLDKAEGQLIDYRKGVVKKDALRTLLFVIIAAGLIFFLLYKEMDVKYFALAMSAALLIDFWPIDLRYLNNEAGQQTEYTFWVESEEKLIPFTPSYADIAILQSEMTNNPKIGEEIQKELQTKTSEKGSELTYKEDVNTRFGRLNQLTDYRVLLLSGGYSQETSISYYHKSLGGYHSAKIQRYQDLIERKMGKQMQLASNPSTLKDAQIINMLNTKYIITNPNGQGKFIDLDDPSTFSPENQQKAPGFINNSAFGNAWFVSEVKAFNSPDDEFAAIDNEDLSTVATTDETLEVNKGIVGSYSTTGSIQQVSYKANELTYSLEGVTGDHYVVFSEIYYPLGWNAYVDGKKVDVNRVDYALRGMKVPAGTKEVKLKYELKSYAQLSTVSMITSLLILLLVVSFVYLSVAKGKDA